MSFESRRHYLRGWLFHFLGRSGRAAEAYEEAFRHDPNHVEAARHLGSLASKRKDFVAAERWLAEAARLASADASTWFNLGFVRGELGKHREAIEALQAAARLNPNLDRAWYGLGLARAALGEHALAIPAFDETTRLQPMNGVAWYQLGLACHKAGEADRVEAVVRKLLEFDPKFARQLVRDSGRGDLAKLLPDLPF
ncbi:MAG: tetratricopeptide repeat protein [Deferrisomatales bacterium]